VPVTITQDQRIADALALLDRFAGARRRIQVIPFIQQRTNSDVGGRKREGLSS